jgi:uncharacterized coiled-coil DUF342 family protein
MVEHADEVADKNAQWFDGELVQAMHAATTISNDSRVTDNYDLVTTVRSNALENRKVIQQLMNNSAAFGEALGELQDEANDQRDEMNKLREKIDANQQRVADATFPI